MSTYQYIYSSGRHHQPRTALQRVLATLTVLCLLVIIVLLFMVAQAESVSWQAEQQRTSSQVAQHPTLAATTGPSPVATTKPTVAPKHTPAAGPSLVPVSNPHPAAYPVYGGNPHLPEIALSFDDGPNPPYTSQVLSVLQNYGVKATFFVIGYRAATYPALVRQEYEQGNVVGNHTWVHPDLTKLSAAAIRLQLQSTSNAIRNATGVTPTVFRPPYGSVNGSVQSIAASMGLSTVLWNVDPRDWAVPGTQAIIANVLRSVHNGSIILMHDGGGYRSETVAALPTIISTLEQRGFRFVTIPRLIQDMGTGSTATSSSQFALAASFDLFAALPRSFAFIERRK